MEEIELNTEEFILVRDISNVLGTDTNLKVSAAINDSFDDEVLTHLIEIQKQEGVREELFPKMVKKIQQNILEKAESLGIEVSSPIQVNNLEEAA